MIKILCLCEIAARARELQLAAEALNNGGSGGMKFRSTVGKFTMSQ